MADAGGGLCADIGSVRTALAVNASTPQLGYKGPISNGGSIWVNANSIAQQVDPDTLALPLTLECWVWQHYRAAVAQIIAVAEANGGVTAMALSIDATGHPQGYGPSTNRLAAGAITIQQWHHLVVTATAAATTLYVDAIAQPAAGANGAPPAGVHYGVGGHVTPVGTFAAANVAEVALYPTALSPTRINAHFLAADNVSSFPVFQGFGAFNLSTGIVAFNVDDLTSILNAVRHTFPTT